MIPEDPHWMFLHGRDPSAVRLLAFFLVLRCNLQGPVKQHRRVPPDRQPTGTHPFSRDGTHLR